ncbi:MAG: FecR domain-containing protein [Marinilabiliaceae bacterium]|nr:FecR domain-containing protein [Marinilabiliaceae bacterium]
MKTEFLNNEEYLIIRHLNNELTDAEQNQFSELLEKDSNFRKEYNNSKLVWDSSTTINYDAEVDWQTIRQKIGFDKQRTLKPLYFITRIAAVVVIVFGLSLGLWNYWNSPGQGRWVVFETGMSTDSIVLPDESIVFLNKNSSLKFKSAFVGKERKVELTGEGYFEVTHDQKKPFNVEIGTITVQVLGTSFNIDARKPDGSVELNVTDGKVSFANNNEKIIVKEGEWAVMGKNLIDRGIIKDANFLSWKTGLLEFNNVTLNNVAQILKNYYPEIKSIRLDTTSDISVTTRFTGNSLQEILEEFSLHFEKKFKLYNGILIISD